MLYFRVAGADLMTLLRSSAGDPAGLGRACLAAELVPGFLDGLAQQGVAGQRVAGNADGARVDVDVDPGDPGQPADLGPDGAGAVLAAHAGNRDGTSGHALIVIPGLADSDVV